MSPTITPGTPDEPDAEATVPPAVAKKRMDVVAGALGAAGHTIEDPVVLDILKRQAAGKITGDRARRLLREHDARIHDPRTHE